MVGVPEEGGVLDADGGLEGEQVEVDQYQASLEEGFHRGEGEGTGAAVTAHAHTQTHTHTRTSTCMHTHTHTQFG